MKLHLDTIDPKLWDYLNRLMKDASFDEFYLVGGTALALNLGHRKSVDIDLFTDIPYGSIDLKRIKASLITLFPVIENIECLDSREMVYSLFVGDSKEEMVKLDICYDETHIFPTERKGYIRLVSEKEIAAMKLNAIVHGKRRKDFWDLHELLEKYPLKDMIDWALERYPYTLDRKEIIEAIKNVASIEDKTEILCLKGKYWEFIVEDITDAVNSLG